MARTRPRNQGQRPRNRPRPRPGGGAQQGGPGAGGGAGTLGAFPTLPDAPPNFLPNTPGFEHAQGQAMDTLAGAEGAYAQGRTMIPAQLGLQTARLGTDQDVATDRLREDLAGRGVFTARNAEGGYGGTSPAGGGVGQALYNRNVATPFGRARQDLGASGANAYADLSGAYGGAQLGFNQSMYDALGQRANDAFSAMPLNAQMGGYDLPNMGLPFFSGPPQAQRPGRTRPRRNKPKGRGKGK